MPVRVGINGFGRIGRNVFRAAKAANADIEWVAVNDLTDSKTLAHLLQYDSILGPYPGTVHVEGDAIVVDGHPMRVLAERNPSDAALGRPGRRRGDRVDRLLHQAATTPPSTWTAAPRRSIISAPATEPDITVVLGVNFDQYDRDRHHVISNASCTTNCLAPFAKVRQRRDRHRARPDDDDPRLHAGPEPAGRAAQGPAPRPRRRAER